ncbi:poly [ADP-ribose] polymerase tankyrase-like [Biomphalaria glabrata]|uniref:Poly [ADP-ribose] polymerase n=1 Tax=Biomphalaria glabrata TaxID=6526 RepID=A0A9W3AJL5_BIOGL|nr:poly [ADP-ribose] polymerase tankyrase-like [Biomphalaria glabrata]XP_055887321.1 poly [ADP-ribose] polymerase tankyrase-like [Biomphalaria glabrata]XP_055887322.1 poly [ADP-ribose] polymerase tankyrase-like [Biomphalaria glabrata]KAI8773698.1 poly(ADP-ribose) polymerase pme-5 [Biomphalaria glabrata]
MARKKVSSKRTKQSTSTKHVSKTSLNLAHAETQKNKEADTEIVLMDISSLRRMPTDELINDNMEINARRSSRSQAVESVKALTSKLLKSKGNSIGGNSSCPSITMDGKKHADKLVEKLNKISVISSDKKFKLLNSSTNKLNKQVFSTKLSKSADVSKQHRKLQTFSGMTSYQKVKNTNKRHSFSSVKKPNVATKKTLSKQISAKLIKGNLRTANKILWFPKDAILAVRTDKDDDFFLCRTRINVYNYTRHVKINWFVKKPKKYKIPNSYKMSYRDVIDPASIIMQVNIKRLTRVTYQLPNDQLEEIKKLLQVALEVESGKKTVDELDDDVQQVIIIDQPSTKKPRLQKTASQRLRDKEKKVKKSKEPKGERKSRQKIDAQGEPKRKRPTKKTTLTLQPRTDIKILALDPLFETRDPMPYVSKAANSRLVFRAIHLKDNKLLTKLLKDGSKIYKLHHKSLDNENTPASAAGLANDKNILLTLLEEFFGKKFKDRCKNNKGDKHFLDKLGTGRYNRRSLGINFIRKITASRGSREGNNAFVINDDAVSYCENDFITEFLKTNSNPDLLKVIEQFFEEKKQDIYTNVFSVQDVHKLLLSGLPYIAGKIIQANLKYSSRVFHHLFRDVLLFTNEDLTGCSPSNLRFVSKRVFKLSVFHCAAANSNSKYLEKLLSVQPDVHIVDSRGNRPLHFAAACESPDNVRLLLEKGANFNDTNNNRELPLHIAIQAKRPENVRLLLEAAANNPTKDPFSDRFGTGGVNRCDNSSRTPLHLAADHCVSEVAEILLKFGANVNAKLSVSQNQLSPLMTAAAQGDLKMVQLLVKNGADVEQKDRMERRAVIHACMNGSTNVLSYLLNIGASAEHPDSSGNSPLHYAAAYGWYFTAKLLLEAGVDPNANNMWKLTPVNVAYLKSQVGIVQLLLNHDKVDINFADDNGKTLIFHACESDLLQPDLVEQIKYIIEQKGALCNIRDNSGQTPLHCLASNSVNVDDEEKNSQETLKTEAFKQSVSIAQLLIKHGCDVNAVDDNNDSAAMMALSEVINLPLCEYLLENGSPILMPAGSERSTTMLHSIASSLWEAPSNLCKVFKVIQKFNYLDTLKSMASYVDCLGFTPLQTACLTASKIYWVNYESIEDRKVLKKNWDNVRAFIRLLVDELGSDVNAKVQKRYYDEVDMPAPNSDSWWYSKETAGRTAAHIIMLKNDPEFDSEFKFVQCGKSSQIFKDLVLLGTDLNVLDESGNSPLSTCILSDREDLFEFMVTKGNCNLNLKVKHEKDQWIHPLILAATRFSANGTKNSSVICKLIELGCDLNCEASNTQKKILHCVATAADPQAREEVLKIVNKLAEREYNFNSLDGKKRTAMHYALKTNNGGLNQSYELEVKLIVLGTRLGLKDKYGRTALHYIFKKAKNAKPASNTYRHFNYTTPGNAGSNDPAELTKLIGRDMNVIEINEKDKYGQTVLHLAAKQGATFCCMYLTLVGAAVNIEDNDGNTALSLAVQNKFDGCAATLIQSGSNLKSKVIIIQNEETVKLASKENKNSERKSKGREKKDIWQWNPDSLVKVAESVRVLSLYQAAIEFDLPGVAMFVTEASLAKSGLSQQDAITTALKSCKYNIALRLLCTTTDISVLHIKREHSQSLLHVLALSGADYKQKNDPILVKIADFLFSAGLSANEGDEFNCNPIMYAVLNRLFPLADFLAEKSDGYDVKYTDNFNRSYLAAVLWRCHSSKIDQACWDFIEKLLKAKIDLNQYFDLPLNPDLATIVTSESKKDPDYWISYPGVKTTALFAAICCLEFTISYNILAWGANPNLVDGNDLTPLMYAVLLNRTNHVRQLLNYDYDPKKSYKTKPDMEKVKTTNWNKKSRAVFNLKASREESDESSESSEESMEESDNDTSVKEEYFTMKKTSSVNLFAKDGKGRTALHYAAQTHSNGTFDNDEAAFVLVKAGAKLTTDSSGMNPYQLAVMSGALKVAEVIRKYFVLHQERPPESIWQNDVNDGVPKVFETWPDFKEASEKVLRRYDSSKVVQDVYLHEVDSYCNITDGELLKDEEQNIYYDVLMTKVDVKQGEWGLYNFYQMQIVCQPKKSLFVLFTRWGRIEDAGQFQHTPYSTKEEAVKEFMKIFREKSGNKWINVKNFERKPNKYRLIEDAARKAPVPQKDVDFNLESNVSSRVPKHLYMLVETLMNPKSMQLSMTQSGKNELSLALGQLNKELLLKGKDLLDQIEKLVEEVEQYRRFPKDKQEDITNKDIYRNNLEKIAELSNEYFHVIPTKNFSCEKIRPLDQRKKLMVQIHNLSNLLDYEIASKMMLAAMHYKTVYNPVDYVYRSIGCKIEMMTPRDEMSQMILKYISLTGTGVKVYGIYKLQRNGESDRLKSTGLADHRLLWHGTNTSNLLSILNRGLVICPPEAQMTGWAYGKGIYFSDAFNKSASYIATDGDSSYMLLCEVALGDKLDYKSVMEDENNKEKRMKEAHNSVVVQSQYSYFNDSDWFHLPKGVCLPQESLKNTYNHNSYYTQYVILDPAQVCLRYLVEFSK